MRRSEAAKLARWSVTVALLIAALTASIYLHRTWAARSETKKAPPPAPRDVTRLSSGLTFSKMEGDKKIFTVEASKSTDFKDRDASLLEDVKITIFGKMGLRHDMIHTQICQYEKDGGNVICSGEVLLDLESADVAATEAKDPDRAASQKVHVKTWGVTFNRTTGTALTDHPVTFVFPSGKGTAVGAEYRAEQGHLKLLKNVQLLLTPGTTSRPSAGADSGEQVSVTGDSLEFSRDSRIMRLNGPVTAISETAKLDARELKLILDERFRAEKLLAFGRAGESQAKIVSLGRADEANLMADSFSANFGPEGWLSRIEGTGSVHGTRHDKKVEEEFSADNSSLNLVPHLNQPEDLNLQGHVLVRTHSNPGSEERLLNTEALLVEFAHDKSEGSKVRRAQTLTPGSIQWTDASLQATGQPGINRLPTARTRLQGDKLELTFVRGQANQLIATGNVQTERAVAGEPLQTATSRSGVTQLLAGGWSQMDMQGDVKLREGDRSAQADHALFLRAAGTALLTGHAMVRDSNTETQASRITFAQATGDVRAEVGVRSSDFSMNSGVTQLAPVPANLSSDTLQANSRTGRALYSGHARFWQGDSVTEAESIELQRDTRILIATGNVRAVFPQTPAEPPYQAKSPPALPGKAKLWHISAGTLTYFDLQGRAHLEKNVVAQSPEQKMRGAVVDLFFTRAGANGANLKSGISAANAAPGAQQISRAVGIGSVIVDQGARRAIAERGEYTADDGKFVMSGGNPTIFDSSRGTTVGHQLTFFLSDDTIIVDSENGSRTLTKHRVEK